MNFKELTHVLAEINQQTVGYASKAINLSLTIRNWLYGYYIQEYELQGEDRAEYGEKVMENLSKTLEKREIKGVSLTSLKLYRKFYIIYPQIGQTVSDQLLQMHINVPFQIGQTPSDQSSKSVKIPCISSEKLLKTLSFNHFVELIQLDDPLKRVFYEMESIKGAWAIRELRRQIGSLYYERSAMSKNKEKLSEIEQAKSERYNPADIVRDPYVFEFLGIKSHEVILESQVADGLLDKLQGFLLELGKGFCFEARNKRILIGDEYFFIDLVFYHRVLKCNVIIELKTGKFTHEHLGQLNTYVKYFKKHEMHEGDNPPIGILLCTEKNHALVEYAMDENASNLFVSKYQLELPTPEEMQKFIERQLN